MTAPETVLSLRIAGWSLADISDQLGHPDTATTQRQLTAELEGTRYALLGEDALLGEEATLHLLRLNAITAVTDRALTDPHRTPRDRLHARSQRSRATSLHAAALETMTRRLGRRLAAELTEPEETDR
ncbi:hypothetical protein [Williamsia sp. 1135]|uniref:hypothetical protein n=1 Tax=Williamsia sp. 1135 TaxID=1889262 RepID=UPI000A11587B|nr:hypothetical protein [Williamsia sp. 1135]ORM25194.1 hypothetical protein BFL43_26105 [Williamsia sp. 1135]